MTYTLSAEQRGILERKFLPAEVDQWVSDKWVLGGDEAVETAVSLIEAAFTALSRDTLRQRGYQTAGVTTDDLVVALWEKVIEGRDGGTAAIQTKRARVKTENP